MDWTERFLDRRWFALLAASYAVTVGVRVVELAGDEAPTRYAAGVYAWEQAPASGRPESAADQTGAFRWTAGRAFLMEPVGGAVLHVPLYLARPDLPAAPVVVEVRLDGIRVDRLTLTRNGWHQRSYSLPDSLGNSRWMEIERLRQRSLADPDRARPPTVWLQLDVQPTFVPALYHGSTDTRQLGIGVGVLRWSGEN